MSDLAQRIMDAWLLTNPKPSENPERAEWWSNYHRLQAMVKLSAYESAVIQFLVPVNEHGEKFDYVIARSNGGMTEHAQCGSDELFFGDVSEALLNAIESANR